MADDQRHRRLRLRHRRRPADPRLPWPAGGGARSAGRPHREAGHRHRKRRGRGGDGRARHRALARRDRGAFGLPLPGTLLAGRPGAGLALCHRPLRAGEARPYGPGRQRHPHRLCQSVVARAPGAQPARHHRPSRLSRAHVRLGRRTGAARRRRHAQHSRRRDRRSACAVGERTGRGLGHLVPRLRPPPGARARPHRQRGPRVRRHRLGNAGARQHGAARRQLRGAPCGHRPRCARGRPCPRTIPARRLARGARRRCGAGARLGGPARAGSRPVHRRPPPPRRQRRTHGDRRISLVLRLGPRHHDQPARADARRPAAPRSPARCSRASPPPSTAA